MSLTVVVGGQYGSEGKGKICSYLAAETDLTVRAGGPNSGHTVVSDGETFKLQQVPSTFLNPDCDLAIAAGAAIDLDVLLSEVERCGVAGRLTVDPQAVVIEADDRLIEADLREQIGSTVSGTGSAMARRALRGPGVRLARDVPQLRHFIGSASRLANVSIDEGKRVLLEGSQGMGLSLYHGPFPYVTGRDTSPGALCSEVGVSPRLVTDILLVLRTYPIRVAGNSGPLPNELTWEQVTRASRSETPIIERTTVTNGVRRVARFDWGVVEESARAARPTQIALNFVDYLDVRDYAVNDFELLSDESMTFVEHLEGRVATSVTFIGTGPAVAHVVDRRSSAPWGTPSRQRLQSASIGINRA